MRKARKNLQFSCKIWYKRAIFARSEEVCQVARVLTEEVRKVTQWLYKNKLTLNVKRTKVMLFGSTVEIAQNTEAFAVKIQNNILEQVNSFKYLGVYLDPNISWKGHLTHVKTSVNRKIGLLQNPFIFKGRYIKYHVPVTHFTFSGILWCCMGYVALVSGWHSQTISCPLPSESAWYGWSETTINEMSLTETCYLLYNAFSFCFVSFRFVIIFF